MIITYIAMLVRICTNSYINVFQKILSKDLSPLIINCYTYLLVSCIAFLLYQNVTISKELILPISIMGMCGCLGNYFIVKALSCGELSSLAPINSYKPIVALFLGIILLGEFPSRLAIVGILLILLGTYILNRITLMFNEAYLYRFLALIFSATEAIFIKKIILLSNVQISFLYWAISGFVFSFIFALCSAKNLKVQKENVSQLLLLTSLICLMQYSTNYIFSKIDVSSALAIFQLSTLLSVFLGISIFKEKELFKKIFASIIMCSGAVLILLN